MLVYSLRSFTSQVATLAAYVIYSIRDFPIHLFTVGFSTCLYSTVQFRRVCKSHTSLGSVSHSETGGRGDTDVHRIYKTRHIELYLPLGIILSADYSCIRQCCYSHGVCGSDGREDHQKVQSSNPGSSKVHAKVCLDLKVP